jgi:GT2 family glycosyltransferase
MFTKNTALIIPTRNRKLLVLKLIKQIKKFKFKEIYIIDSSDPVQKLKMIKEYKKANINIFYTKASSSFQRNYGLHSIKDNNISFVMFLDDDIVFHKNAFINMNKCISDFKNNRNIVAFGFNQVNKYKKKSFIEKIKNSEFCRILRLYSNTPGKILSSGWHTKILNLKKNTIVDWLPTAAVLYRYDNIKEKRFANKFGNYSYLEDLDFSLKIKKVNSKFLLVSDAKFYHPNEISRVTRKFGYVEIINRFYIVQRHNLNNFSFFYMSFVKTSLNFFSVFTGNLQYFLKFIGNIQGILKCISILIVKNFR